MSQDQLYVYRLSTGTYEFEMPEHMRSAIGSLVEQFTDCLDPSLADSRRLFPVAYPDDPDQEAGYQVLSQDQLIDQKHTKIEALYTSLYKSELSEKETEAWLCTLNDIRLFIGTKLDISEEEDRDIDKDEDYQLYCELSAITELFVEALSQGLPLDVESN